MPHGLKKSTVPLSSWNTRNLQRLSTSHAVPKRSPKKISNVAAIDNFVGPSCTRWPDNRNGERVAPSGISELIQTQCRPSVNYKGESEPSTSTSPQDSTPPKKNPQANCPLKHPITASLLHSNYMRPNSKAQIIGLRHYSAAKIGKGNAKASSPMGKIILEMLQARERSSALKEPLSAQPLDNSGLNPNKNTRRIESREFVQRLRDLISENKLRRASQRTRTEIKHEEWRSEEWKPEEWKDEWADVGKMPQSCLSNEVRSDTESNKADLKSQKGLSLDPKLIFKEASKDSGFQRLSPELMSHSILETIHSKGKAMGQKKTRSTKMLSDPSSRPTKPGDLRRASRIMLTAQKQMMRDRLQRSKLTLEPKVARTERPTLPPKKSVQSLEPQLPQGTGELLTSGTLDKFAKEDILKDVQVDASHSRPIPRLQHGLDRVLFNQSVHWLQDPHSRVYNFPPLLQSLPVVTDFAFERLPSYQPSSEDNTLRELAREHSKRFVGTTSSLTRILSHIYFLLSDDKLLNTSKLSMAFVDMSRKFTSSTRVAYSFSLIHRRLTSADGNAWDSYAVDAGLGLDPKEKRDSELNVLLWMGTMMEKFLTYSPEEFAHLLRKNPSPDGTVTKGEAYRYSKSSKFIMRSQLDCHDPRLPGTGVFDLKTRAVLPIRLDQLNLHENSGYLIRSLTGEFESFEREYYDLIRSAFLKYNLQARIGAMDGIFVAYHNTEQQFGFQYVPVKEMENAIYGSQNPDAGRLIFHRCVEVMEVLLEQIVSRFPAQSLHCTIHKSDTKGHLDVWARPVTSKPGDDSIELLKVKVSHLVNNNKVDGRKAIEHANESWTVDYYIQRSIIPRSKVWSALALVMDAARSFAMYLPDGVSESQALKRLALVNYGAGIGLQWDSEDRISVPSLEQQAIPIGYKPLVQKSPLLISKLRVKSREGRKVSLKDRASMRDHVLYRPSHVEESAKPTFPEEGHFELTSLDRESELFKDNTLSKQDIELPGVKPGEKEKPGEKKAALVFPASQKRTGKKRALSNTEHIMVADLPPETLSGQLLQWLEQRKGEGAEKP